MAEVDSIGPALASERKARLERWLRYIEIMKQQVWELHHHRAIWREMRDALLKSSPEDQTFFDHYTKLYTERQLMAVRRLVDPDPRAVSVTRLLVELAEHPESMTRSLHVNLWKIEADTGDVRDDWLTKEANATFDKYADGDGENVDPAAVRTDLDQWRSDSGKLKKIVDKRIAHFDAGEQASIPKATYDDLDRAIDAVGELVKKYTLLFTASSIGAMVPVDQGDWRSPFRDRLFDE